VCIHKALGGAHRADRARTAGSDADGEQIQNAGGHGGILGATAIPRKRDVESKAAPATSPACQPKNRETIGGSVCGRGGSPVRPRVAVPLTIPVAKTPTTKPGGDQAILRVCVIATHFILQRVPRWTVSHSRARRLGLLLPICALGTLLVALELRRARIPSGTVISFVLL